MFAIVEIAGLQYKVEQDQKLYVNRLKNEKGDKVTFDKVLLTVNGAITVGAPAVKGISVEAEVLDHVKGDKVIVFKKKRRKGYKVKNGHRQQMTQIQITGITGFEGSKKSESKKSASTKAQAVKSEAPKAEAPKKAEPKKAAEKKAETKKTEAESSNANSDNKTVNFGEAHELNYHLRKHGLSQSKANRETLSTLGKELKEQAGERILTHEEVDELIQKNIKKFEEIKK